MFFLIIDSKAKGRECKLLSFSNSSKKSLIIDDAIINPGLTQHSIDSFTIHELIGWPSKHEWLKTPIILLDASQNSSLGLECHFFNC